MRYARRWDGGHKRKRAPQILTDEVPDNVLELPFE